MDENQAFFEDEFLARWLSGDLTEGEKTSLESRLKSDPDLRATLDQIRQVWITTGKIRTAAGKTFGERWLRLSETIGAGEPSKRYRVSWPVYAATVAAALLLSYFFWPSEHSAVRISTARGESTSVQLPGGSMAALNSVSELSYDAAQWDNERKIQMSGEIYFEVTRKAVPFTVISDGTQITVLGTSFNVRSRSPGTEVACVSGRVSVETPGVVRNKVVLSQGKAVFVDSLGSAGDVFSVDPEKYIARLSGEYFFEAVPLPKVFEEIERQFDVAIETREIPNLTFTGGIVRGDLNKALQIVCVSAGLDFSVTNDSTVLVSGGFGNKP